MGLLLVCFSCSNKNNISLKFTRFNRGLNGTTGRPLEPLVPATYKNKLIKYFLLKCHITIIKSNYRSISTRFF